MKSSFCDYAQIGRIDFSPGSQMEVDFLYREIFEQQDYLRHDVELCEGDTVFDVGAHIGLFALFAYARCRGRLSLFSFEPIPETYLYLQKNLFHQQRVESEKVRLFNCGLTFIGGPRGAEFVHFERASANSTMKAEEKYRQIEALLRWVDYPHFALRAIKRHNPILFPALWVGYCLAYPTLIPFYRKKLRQSFQGKRIHCQLTTIAEICREYEPAAIHLLKIDVEGAELDVLRGLDESAWRKTHQIVIETHDVEKRPQEIETMLRQNGFDMVTCEKPAWAERAELDNVNVYARRSTPR